jgi:dihydroneopterin aldolase
VTASSSDLIELRGLRALGVIGVCREERERAQPFEVDLDLYVDLAAAGRSDELGDTVDYGAVIAIADTVVRTEQHLLLERVSQRIADDVLAFDPRIDAVRVVIRKLRPPVPQDVATTAVSITRRRSA